MTDDSTLRQEAFTLAINQALLLLRFVVGQHPVCPVCFCDAVAEALGDIGEMYEHNEMVEPLTLQQLQELKAQMLSDLKSGTSGWTKH